MGPSKCPFQSQHPVWESLLIVRLAYYGLIATLFVSCTPFIRYHDVTVEFAQQPDGTWQYIDEDLIIRLHIEPGPKFSWYFKNQSLLALKLDQQYTALYLENDPTPYTLWGKPRNEQPQFPVFDIVPGDFIEVGYPVQVNSPLFPFNRKQALMVDMVIAWNGKPTSYRLIIPAKEKPKPEQE